MAKRLQVGDRFTAYAAGKLVSGTVIQLHEGRDFTGRIDGEYLDYHFVQDAGNGPAQLANR